MQLKLKALLFGLILLGMAACTESTGVPPTPPASMTPLDATATAVPPTPTERPVVRQMLRFAVDVTNWGTGDPHFAAGLQDRMVAEMVFNGLIRYRPGAAPALEPDLAEDVPGPEIIDGKQTWTFHLRHGVQCQAGPQSPAYELTADDVVYSLQKSADPKRSAYSGEYSGMTVEKIDDYTIRITQDPPLSPILFLPKFANYAGGFIVCRKAIEAMGDEEFKTHPVGTGPFQFESFTPEKEVSLLAHDDYFRGTPRLTGFKMLFIPAVADRETALKEGRADLIVGEGNPEWLARMEKESGIAVDVNKGGEVMTVHFNLTRKPMDNILVRQAIAYTLDRNTYLQRFGDRLSEPTYSAIPAQSQPGGLSADEVRTLGLDYSYDPDKARQLLAQAGYPDGFAVEMISSKRTQYSVPAEIIKEQLGEIGITVTLVLTDHATMHTLIRQDKNPLTIYIAWRPNADVILNSFYHSNSIVVTGAKPDTNFSHYGGADELIESARLSTDPDRQIELWKQTQVKILKELAGLPLYTTKISFARLTTVEYGHELNSSMALYPQITELTEIVK